MLLPQEIAEQLSPEEYETLVEKVYTEFKQGFGVVKVTRKSGVVVEVQLDDRTNHDVKL